MASVEFRLPDVGEGIHEAEIVKWLVQEGERVREFDPIVEVQTDKALVELPAPASGTIAEIFATPGTIATVGDVIVVIETSDSAQPAPPQPEGLPDRSAGSVPRAVSSAASSGAPVSVGSAGLPRPKATPGVRHYARRLGVPLAEVAGTGPGGRITKSDIDRYAAGRGSAAAGPAELDVRRDALLRTPTAHISAGREERTVEQPNRGAAEGPRIPVRVPFRGIRRATAEHVKRSAFTAPHVTTFDECDATELVALRKRWNAVLEREGKRITYLPFLVKATVSALKAFPYLNARLDEEAQEIELLADYHIGIAVDTADGLFVPVIRNADELSVREIAEEVQRLTEGVKNRTLGQEQLRGSTFTITNMGPIGGLFATPILNYPEVGILAVHPIQRKPVAVGDEVVIRDVLTLSLSFDHRVIDGATSVRFMNHLKALIEHPESLMLEMR